MAETGQPIPASELSLMRKDGSRVSVFSSHALVQSPEGGPELFCLDIDISERKRAEEELRLFKSVIEHSDEAIAISESNGMLIYINPAHERLFHRSLEEARKLNYRDYYPEKSVALLNTKVVPMLRRGESWEGELDVFDKNGRLFPLWERADTIRDSNGNMLYAFHLMHDITDRKQAEEEKEKLQAKLQQAQKMEAVGILAGGIAHEFNNLLQSINGHTELLLMDKLENDPDGPSLKAIKKSGTWAALLVKQLLLFSRKLEVRRRPVELNQEVEQAVRMLELTIPKTVDIEIHLDNNLWMVKADSGQVQQTLLNLGSNAADAMPHGGKIVIETANITLDEEYAQPQLGAVPGNYVLLTVSDTGHGMDQATVQHIFDPFFTTKEIGKGTGLGLASVYGIVKGHEGYITCYSEPGKGTNFKIYLPAIAPKDAPRDKTAEI
ncbi:MAG: PAS domain S-box protein [Deltaproteobacteria bacterium]|nr:PAS domain S-box protein [Deltaproteobacteria bacterium]